MTKEYCDICGREIKHCDHRSRYKVKRLNKHSGRYEKLTVHYTCWKELCREISERRAE